MKFVPCASWIRRGVSKEIPHKIALEKDEVKQLLEEATSKTIKNNEESQNENSSLGGNASENLNNSENISETILESRSEGDDDDGGGGDNNSDNGLEKYNLDNYEEEGDLMNVSALKGLVYFPSNDLDPYITLRDEDDESDIEDFQIRPDDNVIAIGIVDEESSNVELHVYNETEDQFFIHHDIFLPTMPLCLEWMDYDAGDPSQHGNFLAVGGMSPTIEVWDVDVVDSLEPAFVLGSSQKKKKKKKMAATGHKDAVLALAWNAHVRHILASGSADFTVALWDMSKGEVVSSLDYFSEKVQSLKWHPFEPHNLLSGGCDSYLRLTDCRDSQNVAKMWKCDGEIEHTTWNHLNPFYCLASTENGFVHCYDARSDNALWTLSAHPSTCTGLQLSCHCPGFMVTSSLDHCIKIWDILDNRPSLIHEVKLKLGKLHCLAASPDSPFVFFVGGDNKSHNFKIIDLMEYSPVQKHFHDRGLMIPSTNETHLKQQSGNQDVEMETSAMEAMDLSDAQLSENTMVTKKSKRKAK